MRRTTTTTVASMLALALLATPLAACGGQPAQSGGTESTTTDQASGQTASQASAGAPTASDIASWKTLGDAIAHDTGSSSAASWDEDHYITMFDADGTMVRVVAKMTPTAYEQFNALDMSQDDYQEKFLEVMGGLELVSAEDVTSQRLSPDELNRYVGKTGQALLDDGFAFQNYWMYGGEQTGATMSKGLFDYDVTFDTTVPENQAEDEGAAVRDATIVSVECAGPSNDAVDPEKVS